MKHLDEIIKRMGSEGAADTQPHQAVKETDRVNNIETELKEIKSAINKLEDAVKLKQETWAESGSETGNGKGENAGETPQSGSRRICTHGETQERKGKDRSNLDNTQC